MDEPPRFPQSSRKFALAQRRNMTKAESMLRRALRNHQIDGYGFRRQTPIGQRASLQRATPHPALRATFPSKANKAGEGNARVSFFR
ncbi:MAG TPA: DUF559 domain-containing protein [Roseiarcus sp.]|nr:DUF559 domain-containing protein [Roseiarcus sp.]